MKYSVITSMSQNYYNHSGRAMIKSFSSRFGHDIFLNVYNEDSIDFKFKKVNSIDWNLGKDYLEFQERWKSNSKICSFAKKAFSIIHAMNEIDCDRLIWLDADIIVDGSIPMQLLELISPDDVLSTHYGVVHEWPSESDPNRTAFSCETGFFILNKKHKLFNTFKEIYTDRYINDRHQDIRRFYDGEVYGATVLEVANHGAKMLDLNPGNIHKTPIPRSILSPYISHHKAGLKDNIDYASIEKQIDDEI